MKGKIILTIFVCLFLISHAAAQSFLKIDESKIQIILNENSGQILFAVDSQNETETTARIEFLDPKGVTKAFAEKDFSLIKGENKIEIPVAVGDIINREYFGFYRLRYQIGDVRSTISVSRVAADIFDLEAFAIDLLQENARYVVRVRAIQPIKLSGVPAVKLNGKLKIEFDDNQEKTIELETVTDVDGFADLEFQLPKYTKIEDLDLKIKGGKSGFVREVSKNPSSDNFQQNAFLYFQTDKPIYQPSQKIRIRTLFFDSDRKAIAGENLTFSIKDGDGTTLQKVEAKTSKFGVATVEWEIPENAKLGEYEIIAESARELAYNRKSFKVSRYDLPNFVVNAEADRKFYLPENKNASVEIRADYLFGKPLTKAKVRVVQEFERDWNYKLQKYETKEGKVREGELDASGKFVADFDLNAEHEDFEEDGWRKFEDLKFAAYVTDVSTNRTEQRRFDVRLTKKPIHAYLIGDTGNLSKRLPPKFFVTTFYADGTPAACDVKIYQAHDDSEDEKPKTGKLLAKLKTNGIGAGKISIPLNVLEEDDDELDLVIAVKDAQGNRSLNVADLNFDEEKPAIQIETDKTVYRTGEMVKVSVVSSQANGVLNLDVLRNWQTLDSRRVKLENGRATLEIPYRQTFKNALTFFVYSSFRNDYGSVESFSDNKTVVYPSPFGLRVDAETERNVLRPSEEAVVNLTAQKADGTANETAFGVVVLDKAIEERARTDGEFGGRFQSFYSDLESLLGYERGFGGISGFEIDNLDTTKPLAPEAEMAIEIALRRNVSTNIEDSGNFLRELNAAYRPLFDEQFKNVRDSLNNHYSNDALTAFDDESLRKIVALDGINFDALTDAWGNRFATTFVRSQDRINLEIKSAGADETPETADDLTVLSLNFKYFYETGRKIDKALIDYKTRTDDFIRDYKTLREELRGQNLDLDQLRDAWGKKYQFDFGIENSNYVLKIKSGGWDRKFGGYDDFTIWTNTVDYFTAMRSNVSREFRRAVGESQSFPKDENEFRAVLKRIGFDLDDLKDVFGRNFYVEKESRFLYTDKVKINPSQKTEITPVTQEILAFNIKSGGKDGVKKTADDFELVRFVGIVSEKTKDVLIEEKIKSVPTSSASRGAISGKVFDATGAVIPGTAVKANWYPANLKFETTTDSEGQFVLADVPPGVYELTFESPGFSKSIVQNVFVSQQQLTEIDVQMAVGNVSAVVSVTSEASVIDATSSQISVTITQSQIMDLPVNGRRSSSFLTLAPGVVSDPLSGGFQVDGASGSENTFVVDGQDVNKLKKQGKNIGLPNEQPVATPRLREYFPETLLWSPEIVADRNGKAQVKFKLADSLTTWKIGVIASTVNGDVGVAEKEIKAFQPFFAELEPPKFLTVGDEIRLPVAVRNYLSEWQTVKAEMAQADWFRFLNESTQSAEIAPDSSANAIFDFQATKAVKDGRQQVTATGTSAGDAIVKPVTVKPNGQEIIKTQSELFARSIVFDVNFPANALAKTPQTTLKIYPNLFSHVTESVEGLLQRPYGCGEQTISSTYPNLMILKFANDDSKLKQTARIYLKKGYERLLGYKTDGGGFTYWGSGEPNLALTAYAFRFLTDAQEFIAVDEKILAETRDYLVKKQAADGSFENNVMITAYAARTLARNSRDEKSNAAVAKALTFLQDKTAKFDEPYALALYGLALFDANRLEESEKTAARLERLAKTEANTIYWNLETNTPFYGWGTAGRIETTALVVQLLTKIQNSKFKVQSQTESDAEKSKTRNILSKATLFLLKNKDRYGVWHSTQTTINVLDAFLAALSNGKNQASNNEIQIVLNGANAEKISVAADQITPIILDVSEKLDALDNRVEIKSTSDAPLMAQIVASHYIDWSDAKLAESNRALRLDYKCDYQTAAIMQEINCAVETERTGFRGYGMLLAEIGTPPGADVSRESLETAMKNDWSISRYEILPDRIVLYFWAKDGGTKCSFKFKPRYGINAQTPASTVYDYYNEEAKATVAPLKFTVN